MIDLLETNEFENGLLSWIFNQRWFGGKGWEIAESKIVYHQKLIDENEYKVDFCLLRLTFSEGVIHLYGIFIAQNTIPKTSSAKEYILESHQSEKTQYVYDALYDPKFIEFLTNAIKTNQDIGLINFRCLPDSLFDSLTDEISSYAINSEQSNTSIVLNDKIIIKFFRRISRGVNPELEILIKLTEIDCESIAKTQGWINAEPINSNNEKIPLTLAIASEFAANSADGWAMALSSIRDLLAEGDLLASEVGSDFSSESKRLGSSVATIHKDLLNNFPVDSNDFNIKSRLTSIIEQYDDAVKICPELSKYHDFVYSTIESAIQEAEDNSIPKEFLQPSRIHGDLHLGQVLRTLDGWIVLDFEGEPSKTILERQKPDLILKDIAGMIRSLDYAAHFHIIGSNINNNTYSQNMFRSDEWSERNINAFLNGYTEESNIDPRSSKNLLIAFIVEKVIYETVYETLNRPTWVNIPLKALEKLSSERNGQ